MLKFGLENTKIVRIPMVTSLKFCRDNQAKDVDLSLYVSMIGSLLYVTTSRLDIAFSVGVCVRYQANVGICEQYQAKPKESHLATVKRIIQYLNNTLSFSFCYTNDLN